MTEKESQRYSFLWFIPQMAAIARAEPVKARNWELPGFPRGYRVPRTLSHPALPSQAISAKLDNKRISCDTNLYPHGMLTLHSES